ncbi:MAG: sugar phosphate isomerase/epimerase, partial [Armatimonadetes bacterium]|nr:sugar phosphate isomerase/epimerase [Armatimonadota bacterium]
KVGLSCIVTPREWTFDETVERAAEAGYEALELVLRDGWEISLDADERDLIAAAERARARDIDLVSVCPQLGRRQPDLTAPDPAVRQASIDTFKRIIDVAAAMAIDTILVVPGRVTEAVAYDQAYYRALAGMQALAPHAEAAGVNLAIEYVWNKFLLSPMEFAQFCDQVGSPRVGFFFDTGNMVIFGYPEQWARICGRHIKKVHLKDFKRAGYQWTPLLEGDVDFPAVMRELRAVGYDDALISEVSPDIAPLDVTARAIRQIMEM